MENGKNCWIIPEKKQDEYLTNLAAILPELRAKAGITQSELAKVIGVSRQTFSAIESEKRKMTWNTYLSLALFFDYNLGTHQAFRESKAFCKELMEMFNAETIETGGIETIFGNEASNLISMLKSLDPQGIHALKTMLWIEYARCTKQSGESVLKSFNGERLTVEPSGNLQSAQKALRSIQLRENG